MLERGKVFLNGREAGLEDAATPLESRATSCGSGWIGQAARGRRARRPTSASSPPLRRRRAAGGEQAGRTARGSARAQERRGIRLQPAAGSFQVAGKAPTVCRPSHRSRYLRARGLREGRADPDWPQGAVQATRAGADLSGRGLRPSDAAGRNLARSSGMGSESADPEGDASARSARSGSDLRLSDVGGVRATRR